MHSSEELGTDVRKPPLCRMCPACPVPTHSREHCRQRGLSAGSQIKAAGKSCFFPEALGRGQQCSVLFPMSLRSYCVPRALLMRVCDHPPLMHRSARGHLQPRHCACSAWEALSWLFSLPLAGERGIRLLVQRCQRRAYWCEVAHCPAKHALGAF